MAKFFQLGVTAMVAFTLITSATPAMAVTWTHSGTMDTDANNRFLAVSSAGVAAVVSHDSDSITLFNASTGSWIATVAVGDGPTVASFSGNGTTLAVLNEDAQTVSLVNVASHEVTSTFAVQEAARSANITPDGSAVYVGDYLGRFVWVYSTRTGALSYKINIRTSDNLWVQFTPNGKTAYVSAQGSSQIAVVNVKQKKNIYDINLAGGSPGNTALSPNRRYLAVPTFDYEPGVMIVDLKHKSRVANLQLSGANAQSVTFSADGNFLYVTDSVQGAIWTIDMNSLSLVDADVVWSAGVNGLILSPDNSFAYLSNSSVDSLWKVTIS